MNHRISITDRAREALLRLGEGDRVTLRLGITAGGCSGLTYHTRVVEALGAYDVVLYADSTLRIIADAGESAYLDGLKVDYSEELVREGFQFDNPNSPERCVCGVSFRASAS